MSTYKKVLIAIDLHGSPDQVLARAAKVTGNAPESVHILSVSPDPAYIYSSYPAYSGSFSGIDWEDLRQGTLEKMGSLAKKAGLAQAGIIAEYGRTTDTILEQARQLDADLIIVGSHGRHGVRLLLGSTANGVLHRAECDVLAVKILKEYDASE